MSIYQNALDSVVLGVEDYNSTDARRLVSAVRNLVAGILLLIKHRLAELSPPGSDEALIKERVVPIKDTSGQVTWKGTGRKTVDLEQMRTRCTSLGIVVDWVRIKKLVDHRNDIEHYYATTSQSAVKGLMADSFIVIRDFLKNELGKEPLTELGQPTWASLTTVAEVYQKEKTECDANLTSIKWTHDEVLEALKSWACRNCGSGLIDALNPGADKWDAELQCRSCGSAFNFDIDVENAIDDFFVKENYESIKDGEEGVTVDCPECNRPTYHLEKDVCLICGESVPRVCDVCGCTIPASELSTRPICGRCTYMMSKDD